MPKYATQLSEGSIHVSDFVSTKIRGFDDDGELIYSTPSLTISERLSVVRSLARTLDLDALKVALGDLQRAVEQKQKAELEVKRIRFDGTYSAGLTESQLDRIFAIIDEPF